MGAMWLHLQEDIQVEQAQKAAAEARAQRVTVLPLHNDAGVVERKLLHRLRGHVGNIGSLGQGDSIELRQLNMCGPRGAAQHGAA